MVRNSKQNWQVDLHRAAESIAALRNYPAQPERPLNLQITYSGVVERLADHDHAADFQRVQDLPELTHNELAAAFRKYPEALAEAIAEHDTALQALTLSALETVGNPTHVYALVGLEILSAVRRWLLPLVLQDVQAVVERNRELDRLEDPFQAVRS